MRNTIRAAAVAGALLVPLLAFPAAADAAVTGCHHQTDQGGQRGEVACTTTGGSQYRAKITCSKVDGGDSYVAYGKWVSSGWSSVLCVSETVVTQFGHETR
jgi:hypothetical protein